MTPQEATRGEEECARRLLACQYCELELPASEHQKHTDYCGARTERCKGCIKYVQQRHLQFHYNSDHKYLTPEEKDRHGGSDSGDEGGDECPVCLGTITLPLALECGHVFCMVCVKGIANTTKNCAICRRDIPRDMLMDIRFCREEDVIKNYVNKPRDSKKAFRSHSVPSRAHPVSSVRRATTTQDYDDMVSHLLSSRTSSTPYRYQRPSNTHTPATYTPYSYTSITSTHNTTTNTTNSSSNDDDCCCSSSTQATSPIPASSSSTVPSRPTVPSIKPSSPKSSSTSCSIATSCTTTQSSSSIVTVTPASASEARPKRPTSLALSSSHNDTSASDSSSNRGRRGPPPNATQEQYDRWLAFQLAQAEDDVSAAEFNKKHRPPIGRSQSMPEQAIAAVTHRAISIVSSDTSDSSDEDDAQGSSGISQRRTSSNRPPASPRTTSLQSSGSSTQSSISSSYSSSSSLSASSRSPSLTKSSSDSSASVPSNGNSSNGSSARNISTGTRPKSSTGLKKRVSFKEDAPEERRVAPIMLPCEFCSEMFPERDLMRHQTSCDLNETQMPRVRRDSLTSPPLLSSPTRNPNSPSATSKNIGLSFSAPNSNLGSPVSPTSRRKVPPNLPLGSSPRKFEHSKSSISDNHKTPPTSPPPRPPCPINTNNQSSANSNLNRMRCSPQPNVNELADSSSESRPTSVSPCPPHSTNSTSSGISSLASSTRSVSSTPSSSSSASPIPTVVDTPTDIEADFEDDDTSFVKPRRGKLLSSAICSWRHMSGSRDRPKYARSNTAPLEDTGEDSPEMNPVINSHSASQLPPLPPRPESTPVEVADQTPSESHAPANLPQHKAKSQHVFIKRHKKYRAPNPPSMSNLQSQQTEMQSNTEQFSANQKNSSRQDNISETYFRLDSKPLMKGVSEIDSEQNLSCQFCKQVISQDEFQAHKVTCDKNPENSNRFFRISVRKSVQPEGFSSSSSPRDDRVISSTATTESENSTHNQIRRSERAQSVLDERCFQVHRENILQRANSIKESSHGRPIEPSSLYRRWSSREMLFCNRAEFPSISTAGASYGGGAIGGGMYSSKGWSDHVAMVQDDVKSKLSSAKALLYEKEKKTECSEQDSPKPTFIAELRSWLDSSSPITNLPTIGSSRYRSSSVARPSLYSSSNYGGSVTRLNSLDYRSPFSLTDSFGSAFRRRYVR